MADTTPVTATTTDITTAADRLGEQRAALRLRHSQRLTALMEARPARRARAGRLRRRLGALERLTPLDQPQHPVCSRPPLRWAAAVVGAH